MADQPLFILTTETIQQWKDEAARLERELSSIREKLKAAAVLTSPPPALEANALGGVTASASMQEDGDTARGQLDLTAAIEMIANQSQTPLSKAELKRHLAGVGFPKDQLSNYFYTAIHRLKNKSRITVQEDGSVWRAAA
jgi:hypothetical protein